MFDVGQRVICIHRGEWVSGNGRNFPGPAYGAECVIESLLPNGHKLPLRGEGVVALVGDHVVLVSFPKIGFLAEWFIPKSDPIAEMMIRAAEVLDEEKQSVEFLMEMMNDHISELLAAGQVVWKEASRK